MKKLTSLFAVCAISIVLCMPAIVRAQDDTTTGEATETVEKARQNAQSKRKTKEARVTEIKQEVAARKLKIKTSVCEKKEEKLNARIEHITRNANTIKGVIDKHYARVQEFYASGQLTTPDYDTLVAAIELAKANAETSLEALENYETDIDCESEEAASQLDSFRSAAVDAKEDLKTYRKAVVDLISALKSANASENQDSDSNETESNNEGEETESDEQ